jgi:amino acid transporter
VAALLAQALITSVLILAVGTELGRSRIDATLVATHLPPMPWATYYGGFETLVAASAPVFWTFFLGTGLAFFVLRIRDQTRPRPFQTPLYPITPMIFCATCLYMLYSSLTYAGTLAAFAFIPLLLGLPLAIFHRPAR